MREGVQHQPREASATGSTAVPTEAPSPPADSQSQGEGPDDKAGSSCGHWQPVGITGAEILEQPHLRRTPDKPKSTRWGGGGGGGRKELFQSSAPYPGSLTGSRTEHHHRAADCKSKKVSPTDTPRESFHTFLVSAGARTLSRPGACALLSRNRGPRPPPQWGGHMRDQGHTAQG